LRREWRAWQFILAQKGVPARQEAAMDRFAAMRAFVRAVELGSFSKAAAAEGVKLSTVSRYVSALEADMGVALFNRSTRRLHLTEAGATFRDHAVRILADVEDARLATASLNAHPQGLLRVGLPAAFGRRHVCPHLRDFLAEYPDIRVEAMLADATVDLIACGLDVAVRIGALADSSLVARRLAPHNRVLVASPDYLRHHGEIGQPRDLEQHECLGFTLQPKDAWYFRARDRCDNEIIEIAVSGRLRANDSEALLNAAVDGLGVALLPGWLANQAAGAGQLVMLLPAWEGLIAPGVERAIWGVYPPKKVVSPKVRAFLAFLDGRFGRPPYWER
jgi:DNA-binding transcriptional LysR family regulator